MADTYTPNLNLTKPEVGASRDTWGGKTNGDWDIVDAIFAAAGSGTSVGLNVGSGKTLTVAGTQNVTGTFKTDTVSEYTAAAGVTVDGVLLKDSGAVLGAGAVGTPSVTTTGDTNTGLYFPAADTLAATTGGTERLRIDSSGNVGIGTTSPSGTRLRVVSSDTSYADTILAINNATGTGAWGRIGFQAGSNYGFIGIDNAGFGYLYNNANNAFLFGTNNTERMRIDASGNVGIGTSSPASKFDVVSSSDGTVARFQRGGGSNLPILKINITESTSVVEFEQTGAAAGPIAFKTGGSERARITSGGEFLVGTTNSNPVGANVSGFKTGSNGETMISADGIIPFYVNRKTNDGTLVEFWQDGNVEGNISVSGTTVSYNGGHLARWSQLPTNQRDPSLLKGTVLTNLDEMCVWLDEEGNPQPNEQLNKMKISDVEGDPNVAGVFVSWDNDDQTYTDDMNVAMTGDMIIRIAQGVVVQKGDLLMSAGDGTAKPQGDDIRRSKTVAKVTSNHVTCTYADGSYCVPCVLMAC